MVTHPHQWAQEWTHTHTKQMTSLQLPGASTSVGPHGHRVILCNRQSPPTIKNSPALDSWDVALLYWILSTQSCFSAATGHEQDAVVKWHSIFSARLLCFLSPLPVITDNMQVSVHPVVYFIWAGTASSPSSISEFFIWMWLLEESRLPCYVLPTRLCTRSLQMTGVSSVNSDTFVSCSVSFSFHANKTFWLSKGTARARAAMCTYIRPGSCCEKMIAMLILCVNKAWVGFLKDCFWSIQKQKAAGSSCNNHRMGLWSVWMDELTYVSLQPDIISTSFQTWLAEVEKFVSQ